MKKEKKEVVSNGCSNNTPQTFSLIPY